MLFPGRVSGKAILPENLLYLVVNVTPFTHASVGKKVGFAPLFHPPGCLFPTRIVNIIVFILAITAVVFAYLLFQKRAELMKRGDKLASTVNLVASSLDQESGTTFAKVLTKKSLGHKKPLNKQKGAV